MQSKLLTDEQLCELSLDDLLREKVYKKVARVIHAQRNQWQLHQQFGEYLHKIEQLINDKKPSSQ